MFERAYYVDEQYALMLSWFGLGGLQAHARGKGSCRATLTQKVYLLSAAQALEREGESTDWTSPAFRELCRTFASLLIHEPSGSITWRVLFDRPPQTFARACIETSRRPAGQGPGPLGSAAFG